MLSYFEGHTPILVTTDLEIIQEVFIKQFANFSARKVINFINFAAARNKINYTENQNGVKTGSQRDWDSRLGLKLRLLILDQILTTE